VARPPQHLLALSAAAVLTVYGAGYAKTRGAFDRFSDEPAVRRPPIKAPDIAGPLPEMPAPPASVVPKAPHGEPAEVTPAVRLARRVEEETRSSVSAPAASAAAPAAVAAAPIAPADHAPDAVALPSPAAATAPGWQDATHEMAASADTVSTAAPNPADAGPARRLVYNDGTYLGWGTCRHGDIQARIVIENDRIASASVAQCLTRYTCDWIAALPGQVVTRQSPETDYVSGATQSTNAFYYAISDALKQARRPR
jgi:uncharacterized protein with FMN-binding domain